MTTSGQVSSRFLGIGGYVPPRRVSNFDLEKLLDTTDEWIQQRTGIQARHWVTPGVSTSDLAYEASLLALKDAGVAASEIDMIVMATNSPDHAVPGSGPLLQAKLGVSGIPVFEIRQACSGFVYGLSLAHTFIQTGQAKKVLLVGVEVQSKILDLSPAGRGVSVIFADGAGAAVLGATQVNDPDKESHVICTALHSDGKFAKELWIPAPGTANGAYNVSAEHVEQGQIYLQMNSRYVFTNAVTKMPEVLMEVLQKAQKNLSEVDLFFFHQANIRIIEKIIDDLKVDPKRVHNTIHKYGNTTAATIPLGMWDAQQQGLLKRGQLIAMSAFGAGFGWGGALVRY